MQHLDEGTIHSWLDGALSADEAARAEAHVAECPQCAAAVAEARGFIAASSRILTALDHVPRAVVPAAPPVKWSNRAVWRAAAAVLIVAVGSLVVVRNSEDKARVAPVALDSVRVPEAAATQPQIVAPSPEATGMRKVQPPTTGTQSAPRAISSRGTFSGKPTVSTARPNVSAREQTIRGEAAGAAVSENVAASQAVAAAAPTPQAFAPIRLRGATTMDEAKESAPLKVVGTPRTLGAKVTLYEVAPGDTVTLTEIMNLQLNSVVTTGGMAAEPLARRSAGKAAAAAPTQRVDAAVVSAPDSQRAAGAVEAPAPAPSAPVPTAQVGVANGVTTISWADPTTGNVLKLSGRMPAAQLQQIRFRIERERAAAAAAKKKP